MDKNMKNYKLRLAGLVTFVVIAGLLLLVPGRKAHAGQVSDNGFHLPLSNNRIPPVSIEWVGVDTCELGQSTPTLTGIVCYTGKAIVTDVIISTAANPVGFVVCGDSATSNASFAGTANNFMPPLVGTNTVITSLRQYGWQATEVDNGINCWKQTTADRAYVKFRRLNK